MSHAGPYFKVFLGLALHSENGEEVFFLCLSPILRGPLGGLRIQANILVLNSTWLVHQVFHSEVTGLDRSLLMVFSGKTSTFQTTNLVFPLYVGDPAFKKKKRYFAFLNVVESPTV